MYFTELLNSLYDFFRTATGTVIAVLAIAFIIKWSFISWIIKYSVKAAIKEAWNERIRWERLYDNNNPPAE
jgi:hypothetical protein